MYYSFNSSSNTLSSISLCTFCKWKKAEHQKVSFTCPSELVGGRTVIHPRSEFTAPHHHSWGDTKASAKPSRLPLDLSLEGGLSKIHDHTCYQKNVHLPPCVCTLLSHLQWTGTRSSALDLHNCAISGHMARFIAPTLDVRNWYVKIIKFIAVRHS